MKKRNEDRRVFKIQVIRKYFESEIKCAKNI